MIFKHYLKDPQATIAVNTTIFIAGCLFFGMLATYGIVSELIRDSKHPPQDMRIQHLQQHADEQVKYDKMIELLEAINAQLESWAQKLDCFHRNNSKMIFDCL